MILSVKTPLCRPSHPKRKWRCLHWQAANEWAADHVPTIADLQGLTDYARNIQERWNDPRQCSQRSKDRNPYEVKLIACWAAFAPDSARRDARRRHVRAARCRVALREDSGRLLLDSIRRGNVEGRNVALKNIVRVIDNDIPASDIAEISNIIGHKFKPVWKRGNIDAWLRVLYCVLASHDCDINMTEEEVDVAFGGISRRTIKMPEVY